MASASSQLGSQPPETVGFILNKVQEDLARLKDEVSRSVGSGGTVDALAIKAALESTQKELQMHAETTLQLMQDKATTLPHIVHPMSKARGPVASSRRCVYVCHSLPIVIEDIENAGNFDYLTMTYISLLITLFVDDYFLCP